jgi:hypothetical protein
MLAYARFDKCIGGTEIVAQALVGSNLCLISRLTPCAWHNT